jgi:hypothetical protein
MKRYIQLSASVASIAIVSTMTPSAAMAQASPPVSETGESRTTPAAAATTSPPTFAPTTAEKPTARLHDGFYLRANLGFGTQRTTIDDASLRPNFSARTSTMVGDLLVGGAPSPGLVFGGALLLDSLPSTAFQTDGYSTKTTLSLMTVGPFIDAYPNPRGGFHSGGMVGASAAHLDGDARYPAENVYGFGLATWLGYDCWVADQWSVGGLLRFSGAHSVGHKGSTDIGVYSRSIALLLTVVYQ